MNETIFLLTLLKCNIERLKAKNTERQNVSFSLIKFVNICLSRSFLESVIVGHHYN